MGMDEDNHHGDADELARLTVARNGGRAVDAARVAEEFATVDFQHEGRTSSSSRCLARASHELTVGRT